MMRVLITGGSSGLGAALVLQCVTRGDHVVVIDRVAPKATGSAATVQWLQSDLAAPDAVAGLSAALTRAAPFDLVVLSAGISATGPFESIPPARHAEVIAVNLTAPAQIVALLMRERLIAPRGRLVLVSSLSHYTGYPGAAVYAATKDGLVTLARSMRRPLWRAAQVRVQVLAPGPMNTPHATEYAPPSGDAGADARRRADPGAIAALMLAAPARRAVIVPGAAARVTAVCARLLPGVATAMMRRLIYDRLRPPT